MGQCYIKIDIGFLVNMNLYLSISHIQLNKNYKNASLQLLYVRILVTSQRRRSLNEMIKFIKILKQCGEWERRCR